MSALIYISRGPYRLNTAVLRRTVWVSKCDMIVTHIRPGGLHWTNGAGLPFEAKVNYRGVFNGDTQRVRLVDLAKSVWEFDGIAMQESSIGRIVVLRNAASKSLFLAYALDYCLFGQTRIVVSSAMQDAASLAIGYVITKTTHV